MLKKYRWSIVLLVLFIGAFIGSILGILASADNMDLVALSIPLLFTTMVWTWCYEHGLLDAD